MSVLSNALRTGKLSVQSLMSLVLLSGFDHATQTSRVSKRSRINVREQSND